MWPVMEHCVSQLNSCFFSTRSSDRHHVIGDYTEQLKINVLWRGLLHVWTCVLPRVSVDSTCCSEQHVHHSTGPNLQNMKTSTAGINSSNILTHIYIYISWRTQYVSRDLYHTNHVVLKVTPGLATQIHNVSNIKMWVCVLGFMMNSACKKDIAAHQV